MSNPNCTAGCGFICNCGVNLESELENMLVERDAARYRYLRARDLETINKGGVFAGKTPENLVLNGIDLDKAIDAAMLEMPNKTN